MALFVTVSEGRGGAETQPIFASSDPRIIRAVLVAIERCTLPFSLPRPLHPVRGRRAAPRGEAESSK